MDFDSLLVSHLVFVTEIQGISKAFLGLDIILFKKKQDTLIILECDLLRLGKLVECRHILLVRMEVLQNIP